MNRMSTTLLAAMTLAISSPPGRTKPSAGFNGKCRGRDTKGRYSVGARVRGTFKERRK